jgi:tetratricopeptide (TPR) repeat protein
LTLLGAAILDVTAVMESALRVLEQAVDESRAGDDRAAEASAWAVHQLVTSQSAPDTDVAGIQREVELWVPEIERLGDPRALVFLRRLDLAMALTTRSEDLEGAAERLLTAARNTGDRANAFEALFFLGMSGVLGPTPVAEALSDMRQRVRTLADGPIEEGAVEEYEGLLLAMSGELEEGRRLVRGARATFAEFGMKLMAMMTARDEALIERYSGDSAAVERVLRPACEQLREGGETGYLSTRIGELADALYELGRYDEAEQASRESEQVMLHADVTTQTVWRRVRAKVLARRGEGDEALRLAREAIDWAKKTNELEPLGDAYRDMAEIMRMAGRNDQAEEVLERALAAYQQKGLVPMANRTRTDLAALRASE